MFQGEMEGYVQGRIEYILKAFSEIIIVIIEANIEYQSNYGQIISELYNSYLYNKSIGVNIENVYGILTTGENGGNIMEQHFMPVQNLLNYENRIIANRNESCLLNHNKCMDRIL